MSTNKGQYLTHDPFHWEICCDRRALLFPFLLKDDATVTGDVGDVGGGIGMKKVFFFKDRKGGLLYSFYFLIQRQLLLS